jgi:hypothetical protein
VNFLLNAFNSKYSCSTSIKLSNTMIVAFYSALLNSARDASFFNVWDENTISSWF